MFKFTFNAGPESAYIFYPKDKLMIYIIPNEEIVAVMGPLTPQEALQEEGDQEYGGCCEGH